MSALRNATSKLKAEADVIRARLGENAGSSGVGLSKDYV